MGHISNTCFIERRRFPRYNCTGDVEVLQKERCWAWGTVNQISCGGCYIETVHPLPIDTEAELRLSIAESQLDICAVVVSRDQYGMGLAFVVESSEQRNKLSQLIERVTSNMQAALQHLQQAQERLEEAIPDVGNGRATALQVTVNAISGVKAVMASVVA